MNVRESLLKALRAEGQQWTPIPTVECVFNTLRDAAGDLVVLVFDGDDVTIHTLEECGDTGHVLAAVDTNDRVEPLYRLVAAGDGDPQ